MPDGHRRDPGTGAVEGHHRELEALVLLAEQVRLGHLGLVEDDRGGVRRSLAELVLLLVDRHRVVAGDDEGGDPAVAGVLVGLRVDRVPVGVAAVGDEALGAVDHPLVADLLRRRLHSRDVRPGVGLGEAEGRQLRLLGEHAQVLPLDLLGAAERDRRHRQAVGGERGADPGAPPAELLLDQAAGEEVEPGPAVLLGDVGVHQSHLPRLVDDLLGPGAVLVVLPGDLADLLLGEVVRQLAEVLLLVGEVEVHCFSCSFVRGNSID